MGDRVMQVDVRRGVATPTPDSPADRDALPRPVRAQLRAARTGPPAERFPDIPELPARRFAGPGGQEGIAASRGERPARRVRA